MTKNSNGANLGFETQLWAAADKMRGHMDAGEYKHVVLGLIFLKYISDSFQARYDELAAKQKVEFTDPEDRDEYAAANIFWVPVQSRWKNIQNNAKQATIGQTIDDAMTAIERENPTLKGVLPKDYSRHPLPEGEGEECSPSTSGRGAGGEGNVHRGSMDILGRVYEYFLARFAAAEGKDGGEFYTPQCVVKILVRMIEPYKGRVFDPCCGSGGMFVQSERFVEEHGGNVGDIVIYGQESNPTTWRLAKMNLAIRGIDANLGPHHADSFRNDLHKDLKADYILANPPFNMSDWGGDRLRDDARWKYGVPPVSNANYAWIQHFAHHLSPTGIAAFVMANGSMSTSTTAEFEIRKNMIEADLIDCMIALPGQLFYTTQIPVCLWFLRRNKAAPARRSPSPGASRHPLPEGEGKNRQGQTLFIDARRMGSLVDRVHRELSGDEIEKIADTYHAWRGSLLPSTSGRGAGGEGYIDVPGFCYSASKKEIAGHGYVLTPGRYVGAEEAEDDLPAPRPGVFFVYVIACEGGSYYIGHTDNMPRRWEEHVSGKGADWTKKNRPRYIAHYEEFKSREEAVAREKELKTTSGRRWIKDAIANGRARQAGGIPFEEKMAELTATLSEQFAESATLEKEIRKNLAALGFEL